jgi:hypothetical protein
MPKAVLVHKWEAGITKPSHLALKMPERMAFERRFVEKVRYDGLKIY